MEKISVCGVEILIERKKIRNVYIKIDSVSGLVCVSAPYKLALNSIENFARSKIKWILKNKTKAQTLPKVFKNKYITGEKITFFGKTYSLNVYDCDKKPAVFLNFDTLDLYAKRGSSEKEREKILDGFYAQHLSKAVAEFSEKWFLKLNIAQENSFISAGIKKLSRMVFPVFCDGADRKPVFYFKRMKSRWGSCNISDRKIALNTLLAKKRLRCVEYVAVHEMLHLKERKHNKMFKDYMKNAFPDWKEIEEELKIVGEML
ncbi:MAG: M48 family metallopeptidase [Endomicrobium sp.]|jgi:predicted metal-dependent hydrolase|nr:M48 family metallopeptidase [Endomicrobium sp.]